jgi:hypothetical protein
MTAPTAPDTPASSTPPSEPTGPQSNTADAIDAARQRLAEGRSLVEAPEHEGGEVAAGSDDIQPEGLTVMLEGLEERGEEPIEIEAPDEESFNRLNRLQNEAQIGRQVKQERRGVADLQRQLVEVEDMVALDPAGFVLSEHLPENVRTDVALHLLCAPGVIEAIEQRLGQHEALQDVLGEYVGEESRLAEVLANPVAARLLRSEIEAGRYKMQGELRTQHESRKAMQANAREIIAEVDRLIPAHITGDQRRQLFQDAMIDVRDAAVRLKMTQMDPQDVQLIVGERLRQHKLLSGVTGRNAASPAAPARRPAASTGKLPKTTAERIKLAREIGVAALVERAKATT